MLCNDFQCVFVHIPKVAGESIEGFFSSLLGVTREMLLLRSNRDPKLGPEQLSHLTAQEYVRFGHMTAEQFKSYYKFSFVRNPWKRLASEYIFKRYIDKFEFKDFVFNNFPKPDDYSDASRHVLPQYDFLYDSQGNLLVDFVGRFENLQADFNIVCQKLGIKETQLPHLNSNKQNKIVKGYKQEYKPYLEYYDDETKEFVGKIYKKDIETFGYRFTD
ncbi:MAG: sulfotransferase family protein [Moorea sp. SIOASIH]|uniref:sulfotransferase family 2 domain-containing protein n=1 Tax=Moorena sp. SIOASIH TaxID=2607817 RepID=UPI0013B663F6|nr:sulfotransferase family 2 domain-containing protein [Moorena sp. SIOASIH]NEO38726.1 sulfotransferase family protein [Moorena sp. SIOASIH]